MSDVQSANVFHASNQLDQTNTADISHFVQNIIKIQNILNSSTGTSTIDQKVNIKMKELFNGLDELVRQEKLAFVFDLASYAFHYLLVAKALIESKLLLFVYN